MIKTITDYIKVVLAWFQRPRVRRVTFIVLAAILALWVVYRFAAYYAMQRQTVFNATRIAATDGAPVRAVTATRANGVLRMPVAVRGNVARVSAAAVRSLKPGMKIGDGTITSVSGSVDYDTGLYVVRTRGVADGVNMAEIAVNGYWVPVYAVRDGVVLVVNEGVAAARPVRIGGSDATHAVITSGVADGDVIITSSVADGARVRVVSE